MRKPFLSRMTPYLLLWERLTHMLIHADYCGLWMCNRLCNAYLVLTTRLLVPPLA